MILVELHSVAIEMQWIFTYKYNFTRKYPLRGYILGVLAYTTALERLWGDDETLTMWF